MPDVSQYRSELEALAAEYPQTLDPGATGKILLPHMLLAFMLAYALQEIDEVRKNTKKILRKLDDDD